jgi:hypothetical protein
MFLIRPYVVAFVFVLYAALASPSPYGRSARSSSSAAKPEVLRLEVEQTSAGSIVHGLFRRSGNEISPLNIPNCTTSHCPGGSVFRTDCQEYCKPVNITCYPCTAASKCTPTSQENAVANVRRLILRSALAARAQAIVRTQDEWSILVSKY